MPKGVYQRPSLAERLSRRIQHEPMSGCWLWEGSEDAYGYGVIFVRGLPRKTHRVSYALVNGAIPRGQVICHRCDNPICANPDHLFAGTQADNLRDMRSKDRGKTPNLGGEAHPQSKLTRGEVSKMKALRHEGATYREIAERYGVSKSAAMRAVKGETWKEKKDAA